MSNALSQSAQRVQDALRQLGLSCEVVELPESSRTAPEAAAAIGCQVEQIVKSLVFRTRHSQKPILIVASGGNRVNERMIAEILGEPIERADAEWVRERTGYAIGGVPPLAHHEPLETIVDEDLLRYDEIWAAAGTPRSVFRLTPAELQLITRGRVARIT